MRGGPRGFRPGFPCPVVLRNQQGRARVFAYGAITLCGRTFLNGSADARLCNSPVALRHDRTGPTTPHELGPQAITLAWFGLVPFRSPLLRESRFLSFPPATKMCHFAGLPSSALCVQAGMRAHYRAWVSPFGNPRIKGCSAPPRGLSQPSTSFIGF